MYLRHGGATGPRVATLYFVSALFHEMCSLDLAQAHTGTVSQVPVLAVLRERPALLFVSRPRVLSVLFGSGCLYSIPEWSSHGLPLLAQYCFTFTVAPYTGCPCWHSTVLPSRAALVGTVLLDHAGQWHQHVDQLPAHQCRRVGPPLQGLPPVKLPPPVRKLNINSSRP